MHDLDGEHAALRGDESDFAQGCGEGGEELLGVLLVAYS